MRVVSTRVHKQNWKYLNWGIKASVVVVYTVEDSSLVFEL